MISSSYEKSVNKLKDLSAELGKSRDSESRQAGNILRMLPDTFLSHQDLPSCERQERQIKLEQLLAQALDSESEILNHLGSFATDLDRHWLCGNYPAVKLDLRVIISLAEQQLAETAKPEA